MPPSVPPLKPTGQARVAAPPRKGVIGSRAPSSSSAKRQAVAAAAVAVAAPAAAARPRRPKDDAAARRLRLRREAANPAPTDRLEAVDSTRGQVCQRTTCHGGRGLPSSRRRDGALTANLQPACWPAVVTFARCSLSFYYHRSGGGARLDLIDMATPRRGACSSPSRSKRSAGAQTSATSSRPASARVTTRAACCSGCS